MCTHHKTKVGLGRMMSQLPTTNRSPRTHSCTWLAVIFILSHAGHT